MAEKVSSFKELLVWQKSYELTKEVYKLSEKLPNKEQFGLQSQIRRCAVSIPSNISEGKNRKTKNDYLHFLRIAYGSVAELQTQLLLLSDLYSIKSELCDSLVIEVSKMLWVMIYKLEAIS
jgi:four helix bundle protein